MKWATVGWLLGLVGQFLRGVSHTAAGGLLRPGRDLARQLLRASCSRSPEEAVRRAG